MLQLKLLDVGNSIRVMGMGTDLVFQQYKTLLSIPSKVLHCWELSELSD